VARRGGSRRTSAQAMLVQLLLFLLWCITATASTCNQAQSFASHEVDRLWAINGTQALLGYQRGQAVTEVDLGSTTRQLVASVVCGYYHTCFLLVSGTILKCLGDNSNGQFWASSINYEAPQSIDLSGRKLLGVYAGTYTTCVVFADDGSMKCTGFVVSYGGVPEIVHVSALGGARPVQVAIGFTYLCIITTTGSITCLGNNDSGQLGRVSGTTVDLGGHKAVSISAGNSHTCHVLDNGDVQCYGANDAGKCKDVWFY
jgi:alpha-tubulin suppressor-like RCC1 family protein